MEDEMEDEELPYWAEKVVSSNKGVDLKNLTVKVIEASDLSSHYNCFTLPEGVVRMYLIPYLTIEERGKAGFIELIDLDCSSSGPQRIWGGLKVTVYFRALRKVEDLLLMHFDEGGATVITGDNLEKLRKDSKFKEGDIVEIWMFRVPEGNENTKEFCFIFVNQH